MESNKQQGMHNISFSMLSDLQMISNSSLQITNVNDAGCIVVFISAIECSDGGGASL